MSVIYFKAHSHRHSSPFVMETFNLSKTSPLDHDFLADFRKCPKEEGEEK